MDQRPSDVFKPMALKKRAKKEVNWWEATTIRIWNSTCDVRGVCHELDMNFRTLFPRTIVMGAMILLTTVSLLGPGPRPHHAGYGKDLKRARGRVLARHPWFPIRIATNQGELDNPRVTRQCVEATYVRGSRMISLRRSLTQGKRSSLVLGRSFIVFQTTIYSVADI